MGRARSASSAAGSTTSSPRPGPYWGPDGNPVDALKIWEGGLGIWGAIALGALGVWIGCRRNGISFLAFTDAAAPGVALAQAVGRFGNWFNNELYGGPTDLPWGLTIHEWDNGTGRAVVDAAGDPVVLGTFHPTFLYEALFLVVLATLLLVLDQPPRGCTSGRSSASTSRATRSGRIVIEKMRTDEAELIWGQRLNVWTSILVFLLGVWIVWFTGRRAARAREGQAQEAADPEDVAADPEDVDDGAAAPLGAGRQVPGCGIAPLEMQDGEGRGYDSTTWPTPSAPDLAVPGPSWIDDPEDGDAT